MKPATAVAEGARIEAKGTSTVDHTVATRVLPSLLHERGSWSRLTKARAINPREIRHRPRPSPGDRPITLKPKRKEVAETEPTRRQRDRLFPVLETLTPGGVRPKGMSIKGLTDRINKLPEFKDDKVSEDTVGRALRGMRAAVKK
jgi:hypothetical protein